MSAFCQMTAAQGYVARAASARQGGLPNALVDARGDPVPNLANVMIALRKVPELDVFAFDEMQREPRRREPRATPRPRNLQGGRRGVRLPGHRQPPLGGWGFVAREM
jgi:hypothetical protein